jgi:hypothetical protein
VRTSVTSLLLTAYKYFRLKENMKVIINVIMNLI